MINRISYILLLCLIGIYLAAQSEFHLNERYPVSPGGKIFLETDDAEITIRATDREDVSLSIDRKVKVRGIRIRKDQHFNVDVREDDGNLYVQEKSHENYSFMIGGISEEYTIVMEIPYHIDLDLVGDDDDYYIINVDGNISIRAEDPHVEIKQPKGNEFHFEIEDGEVIMDQVNGSLQFFSDDGDLNITNGNFDRINIVTEDGDISIATHLDDYGHYDFEMEDGDMILEVLSGGGIFKINFDDTYIVYDEDYQIVKEKEHELHLKSKGNATMMIEAEDGSIRIIDRFSAN